MSESLQLQPRDLQILQGLFESRLMNLSHLATLHFQGRIEAAKKRTQKLVAAGYLKQRPRRLYQPAIFHLTNRSIRHLRQIGVVDSYRLPRDYDLSRRMQVSELTLRHELEVMNVRLSMHCATLSRPHLDLVHASTWPCLSQFTVADDFADKRIIRPDGFFRLIKQSGEKHVEHVFFIEIDRGSEVLGRLTQRAIDYRQFYKDGGLALWNARPANETARFPFRVLFVLENDERRNNVTEQLLRLSPPILTQVWLTTREEILRDPLAQIWITPKAYRDAVAESDFDVVEVSRSYVYRRQSERERFIAQNVVKCSLL